MAGLYFAWKHRDQVTMVLESAPWVGGRVRTVRHKRDGSVDFEGGPWRIHTSHKRVLKLARDLGLSTTRTTSSGMRGGAMSAYDRKLLSRGVADANRAELESGYEGFGAAAAEEHSYARHRAGDYYVIDSGFDSLIKELNARLKCPVRLNSRVVDVRRRRGAYEIEVKERQGTTFRRKRYRTPRIVFALPPRETERWTVCQQWLRAQMYAVQSLPLHHIYGRLWNGQRYVPLPPTHARLPDSLLSQVVSGDHDKTSFQVSYSGGRRAQFWNRLKLENPKRFRRVLRKELRKALPEATCGMELRDVRSHHFEHATHHWVPAYGFPGTKKSARHSVEPHPDKLPGLYWIGEAFSSVQGWIEGALETADLAGRAMQGAARRRRRAPKRKVHNKNELVIEGRIIDVSKFKNVHPGSVAAIEKYAGKDATEVFEHIRHPRYSWAILYALQKRAHAH